MRMYLVIALALTGCGDNAAAPDARPTPDGPPGFAEAPHAGVPQLVSGGGNVTAAPVVVPLFFTGDSDAQTQLEMFLTMVAASPYWATTTSEYGVGPLTIRSSIVSSDPPPTTDMALQTWLAANTDGTHAGWPRPDANTIFTVFLPAGVVLDQGGGQVSCKAFGAYHSEGAGGLIYALVPRCASQAGGMPLDATTEATSHELIEAATDPLPFSAPAFNRVDPQHYIWERIPGAETGDLCEYVQAAYQRLIGPFSVQRTWSNASAAAGHDPCVPALATPYAGAAPRLTEDLPVTTHAGQITTQGAMIPLGSSKTIEVDLFSDAPTDDWSVEAQDVQSLLGGQVDLAFQWGPTTGHNGAKLPLIITRTRAATRGNEFVITTKIAGKSVAMWWGYIAD